MSRYFSLTVCLFILHASPLLADPKTLRTSVAPAIRSASKKAKTTLIDIYQAFEGDDRNLWTDGVHLNQTGSDFAADVVFRAIK